MKYRIHRRLSEQIREGCEGRLPICINPRWFAFGNVYPDCTHQRLFHLHEQESAGLMVERMIRRFCRKGIDQRKTLSRWRSLRLGIIAHYICDFSCYVHTSAFEGTLREHRAYEAEQGRISAQQGKKALCDFYGADDSAQLIRLLKSALRHREPDSFSPANDLDYALSMGTELASSMLRLCMERQDSHKRRLFPAFLRRRAAGNAA